MSRWVLALVCAGYAAVSVQAQPRPLWEIETFPNDKKVHDVRWVDFSPDGKTLAAEVIEHFGGIKGFTISRLFAWEVATRNESRLDDRPWATAKHARKANGRIWFNKDNSYSLALTDDGRGDFTLVYGKVPPPPPPPRWNRGADPKKVVREQPLRAKLPGKWDEETRAVFAVNSGLTRLALSSRDARNLTLYSVATGKELKLTEIAMVEPTHRGPIESLRFSPDGKTLATADGSASVFLWDVEKAGKNWEPRAAIPAGNYTVSGLAFSPDGRTLTACTFERKGRANLYVIDVAGGKLLGSYALHGALTSVGFSPDSKVLVTGNNFGLLQAWDAEALRNPWF